uniref:Major facilitator superfamily (MFS) profile domain-containing protein n=1 Tax=Bionectria ochroleuca TaxID=29856 RepID=A0A8H7NJ13_BIOOC
MASSSEKAQDAQEVDQIEIASSTPYLDRNEERRLCRKIDLVIMPTVCLLFLACVIDRANIGNARIAGFEKDLGMAGTDYNATLSLFFVSYIVFEIPCNILCKIIGPWLVSPRDDCHAMGVRFILGLFEAGMLPGIAYYLSRWYRRDELSFRLACYIVMSPLAGATGALLASAILTLDNFAGLHTWRMIFVIEGIATTGIGLIAFLTLTDSPSSARWLTQSQKELAEARLRSERVGQTKVLDKIDKTKLRRGILNPITLTTSVVFFLGSITAQGFSVFAPTVVRSIFSDRTVVQQQLLTAPPYFFGVVCTFLVGFVSWKTDRRQIILVLSTPTAIIGYIIFLATDNQIARYAATYIIASLIFLCGAICNGQISANVVSDTARSSAIGWNVMIGNIGGLVSTWSFLSWDGPNFPIGNGLNLASNVCFLIITVGTLFWMKKDNKRRDMEQEAGEARLEGMTEQDIEDLDWKHPSFRWKV